MAGKKVLCETSNPKELIGKMSPAYPITEMSGTERKFQSFCCDQNERGAHCG